MCSLSDIISTIFVRFSLKYIKIEEFNLYMCSGSKASRPLFRSDDPDSTPDYLGQYAIFGIFRCMEPNIT